MAQAIFKDPFSPSVRQGYDQFADIVRCTLFHHDRGREYGITSKDVDETLNNGHPPIKRILEVRPGLWTKADILYAPPLR